MNDTRVPLGLSALVVAGVVIVLAPVALAIRDSWQPWHTAVVVVTGAVATVAVPLAWAWAWRGRPVTPDAEQFRIGVEALRYGRQLVDAENKKAQQAALPPPEDDVWPASMPYYNATRREQ